ncbi:hypothetical protein ERS140147_00012 [Staphylococcus schweitzeri]|uniref:DnaB/C C-terminal domain-containing protein n=2 Tax=Staphylococcus schweitzeri TaxID=1654388 RepID=A0A077UHD5_9STAP|nr:hypothetical protein ERS140147_00012 [Staphylococcus schweitzeri]
MIKDKLINHVESYGFDLVEYAIQKAAYCNSPSFRLVEYLLKEWNSNNLCDLEAVEHYENNKKAKSKRNVISIHSREKTPKWLLNEKDFDAATIDDIDENFEEDRAKFLREMKEYWGD